MFGKSLSCHVQDITTDFVIPLCGLLALSETWLSDPECDKFRLPSYNLITRCKRDNGNMAGGVAIYEHERDLQVLRSEHRPLIHINEERTGLDEIKVCSNDIGDICKAETTVDGKRVLLVATYLSNGTTLRDKMKFFEKFLLPYSIKLKGLFMFIDDLKLYDVPIVLCGDFNINFRSEEGQQFLRFMTETFGCTLNNSVDVSTTRNMTCVDGIFTRNIPKAQTIAYDSYFSHHRPMLTFTSGNNSTCMDVDVNKIINK